MEGNCMEHGGVDQDIVGVVQHVCIQRPTGFGLMHHPPGASAHQCCAHLQRTGTYTAQAIDASNAHDDSAQHLGGVRCAVLMTHICALHAAMIRMLPGPQ